MNRQEFFENHNIHEYSAEGEVIKDLFDMLEQKEADLRAEFQKKIAEINLEHDSMVCENCEFLCHTLHNDKLDCSHGIGNINEYGYIYTTKDFGCNKFKKKQQCTQKLNS